MEESYFMRMSLWSRVFFFNNKQKVLTVYGSINLYTLRVMVTFWNLNKCHRILLKSASTCECCWKRNSLAAYEAWPRKRRSWISRGPKWFVRAISKPVTSVGLCQYWDTSDAFSLSGGRKLDRPLVKRPFYRGNSATTGCCRRSLDSLFIYKVGYKK